MHLFFSRFFFSLHGCNSLHNLIWKLVFALGFKNLNAVDMIPLRLKICFKTLFFRAVLSLRQNREEGTEISHVPLVPHRCTVSCIINITHQNGTF